MLSGASPVPKSGRVLSSGDLAREYGFTDVDGRQPHWGEHFEARYGRPIKTGGEAFYEYWRDGIMEILDPDWP